MKLRNSVRHDGALRYYASRDAVILARTAFATHKLLRISFGKDGSIYVQFPYCNAKQGLLAELPIDPEQKGSATYSLRERGIVVQTDFKFSHHRSGIAQFSKSGQSLLGPRRHSFPLDGPMGHIFQLQLHWPSGFDTLVKLDKKSVYLGFDFSTQYPSAILIRAEWRRKTDVVANIVPAGMSTGPATEIVNRRTGVVEAVYFLGHPPGFPFEDHVLMIAGGAVPLPKGADQPGMVFLGGWDAHEQHAASPSRQLGTCLAFMYSTSESSAT